MESASHRESIVKQEAGFVAYGVKVRRFCEPHYTTPSAAIQMRSDSSICTGSKQHIGIPTFFSKLHIRMIAHVPFVYMASKQEGCHRI